MQDCKLSSLVSPPLTVTVGTAGGSGSANCSASASASTPCAQAALVRSTPATPRKQLSDKQKNTVRIIAQHLRELGLKSEWKKGREGKGKWRVIRTSEKNTNDRVRSWLRREWVFSNFFEHSYWLSYSTTSHGLIFCATRFSEVVYQT